MGEIKKQVYIEVRHEHISQDFSSFMKNGQPIVM